MEQRNTHQGKKYMAVGLASLATGLFIGDAQSSKGTTHTITHHCDGTTTESWHWDVSPVDSVKATVVAPFAE